ncbi:MAG: chloride channel protein [Candidatus Njordarchaeia archaeon]
MNEKLKFLYERLEISSDLRRFLYVDLLGIIAGLIGGLGAIVFEISIDLIHWLSFEILAKIVKIQIFGVNFFIALIPAIGGLIVGPMVFKLAPETKGHGIPEVMEALRFRQGLIRGRVAFIKIIASSITIGTGGSAGKEGAIAQIGASFGSLLGEKLGVGARERKLLVISGLSAGIAGVFNAPLGGAIFGLEILMGGITLYSAIAVLLASVIGAAVVDIYRGHQPIIHAPSTLTFTNPSEILFYFALGIFMGFIAFIWVKLFYAIEDFYEESKILPYLKPAIGGLITGILGVYYLEYGIYGSGYAGINLELLGKIGLVTMLILGTLKMLATGNTVGSGGSGGIFSPSLFIGAMYGGAFGLIMHGMFPGIIRQPFTYSLVGMGALFAATAHAPLTMIVMIPEMSNDYSLLAPMIAACATSYIISVILMGDSNIYTLKLKKKGIRIFVTTDTRAFDILKVEEFMSKDVITLKPEDTLDRVYKLIQETHHHCFPVIKDGKLIGKIRADDVIRVPIHLAPKYNVSNIMSKGYQVIYKEDSIKKAIEKMSSGGVEVLFVVEREDPKKLVGILTKTDLIKAYGYITSL